MAQQGPAITLPSFWRSVRTPVAIFLVLAGLIGGLGYAVFTEQRQALRQAEADELLTIASRKAEEIAHWLVERRSDGEFISREPFLSATVRRWFDTGATEDGERLSAWLTTLKDTFGYSAVMLLDPGVQVRLGAGASQLHPKRQALVRQALASGQVVVGDLHRRQELADGPIDLDLIVPLVDGAGGMAPPAGALVLKIDPAQFLHPLIRSWPTVSPSAETLLVRREGDEVAYLSELRYRPDAALRFRLPLSSPRLIAAQAAIGQRGVLEGVDYRQIPVLAATREIPGTTWSLVVEVDVEEVDAPLRAMMARVALVAALLIAAAAAVTTLGWRQHHIRFVAESYRRELENQLHIAGRREAEEALGRSQALLQTLVESTSDAIFIKDLQGRYLLVNSAVTRIVDRKAEEIIGRDDTALFPPEEADQLMTSDRRVLDSRATATLEETLTVATGEKRVYQSTKGIIIDLKGEVTGLFGIAHDITKRKQAEARLAEQKDLLETILQQAAEAIVMCDAQGKPLLVNAAARRLALGEALDQTDAGPNFLWGKAYYPDGHPIPLQAWPMQKALRGNTTVGAEARVVRPDGSAYDVLISAAPVRGRDGEIIGGVAMFSDITERKRVEEKLLYQLGLTQGITDSAIDSIFVTDAKGRVTCINPEVERAFGYAADELMGKVLHDIIHHHYPDSRPMPKSQCPLARIYLTGESVRDYEDVFFRKDGSTLTVSCSNALLESRGKRLGAVLFVRDITERKRAEAALRESSARLRAIIHAVPDVLLVLDQDGRYLEILTTQPDLLYTDPATLKGRLIGDVLPAEVVRRALIAIHQTLRTGRIHSFEYELSIRKVGKRYFEARVAPLDGLLMGRPAVVLLARDITQSRLTEESLRQAQKMEALGQLTGGVAHDFNNLLAIIQGNLELLAEALDRPELQDLLQRALGAVERGAALIGQLLAFGRRQPLQPKPVNLNTLVGGMSDLLRRTLGEMIQLDIVLADDLPMTVIDPSQFETALLNLVLNARDAMPQGGHLTLETAPVWLDEDYAAMHRSIKPGRYALLIVRDTGVGMPPEVLEHVLEPFFTTKEAGKGSGLGLSMVYGLVNQMEGAIHLYSEVGQGTTVNIYLPASGGDSYAALDLETGETPPKPGQGQLVLVVEDEPLVRQLAVNMLLSLGYRTIEADTAATALQLLEATPQVALLFTDVVLPGGESGVDLARTAHRRRPGLKILFTSGYVGHHLAAFSRQKGAGWLGKPYRKAQLASKLHALLGDGAMAGSAEAPHPLPE